MTTRYVNFYERLALLLLRFGNEQERTLAKEVGEAITKIKMFSFSGEQHEGCNLIVTNTEDGHVECNSWEAHNKWSSLVADLRLAGEKAIYESVILAKPMHEFANIAAQRGARKEVIDALKELQESRRWTAKSLTALYEMLCLQARQKPEVVPVSKPKETVSAATSSNDKDAATPTVETKVEATVEVSQRHTRIVDAPRASPPQPVNKEAIITATQARAWSREALVKRVASYSDKVLAAVKDACADGYFACELGFIDEEQQEFWDEFEAQYKAGGFTMSLSDDGSAEVLEWK